MYLNPAPKTFVGFVLLTLLVVSCTISNVAGSITPLSSPSLNVKTNEAPTDLKTDTVTFDSSVSKSLLETKNKFEVLKPYLTVLGGVLTHLNLGTLYCWGNFVSYTPKKLKYFSGNGKGSPDALIILPFHMIAQASTMPLGPIIQKRLGSRKTSLLAISIFSFGVFVSSYVKSLRLFSISYAALLGFAAGIGYSAPMIASWQWFPKFKGLITGLILAGFGSGPFFFNKIGSYIANPNNVNSVEGDFPDEVYNRFPVMLRRLSLLYLVIGVLGASLVFQPKASRQAEIESLQLSTTQQDKPNPLKEVKSKRFVTFWSMIMLSAQSGLNTVGVYKLYGSMFQNLQSDTYLSLIGGLGSLSNGLGRIFWGIILDKIGFQRAFTICILTQACCMAIFPMAHVSSLAFGIMTCLMFLCMGGNFAMAPTTCINLWGSIGPNVFGYLFSAFSTASLLSYFLTKQMVATVGWDNLFRILSIFSLTAFGLLMALSPKQKQMNTIPMNPQVRQGTSSKLVSS